MDVCCWARHITRMTDERRIETAEFVETYFSFTVSLLQIADTSRNFRKFLNSKISDVFRGISTNFEKLSLEIGLCPKRIDGTSRLINLKIFGIPSKSPKIRVVLNVARHRNRFLSF